MTQHIRSKNPMIGVSDGGATKPVYKSSQRPPERCDEVTSRPGCWFVNPDWAANMGAEGRSQRLTITDVKGKSNG